MNQRISPGLQRLALHAEPLLNSIQEVITDLLQSNQFELVVVIGHKDVAQYFSNAPRERGVAALRDLFARWQLDIEDVLPDQVGAGVGRDAAFEYLLSTYEKELVTKDPNAPHARVEVLDYVARLGQRAKR